MPICRPKSIRSATRVRARSGLAVGAAAFVLAGGADTRAEPAAAATVPGWPAEVNAVYRISFGGIDIGSFKFQSKVEASAYALAGQASIRAPLGAFEWKGTTNSAGSAESLAPRPKAYTFDFNSSAIIGKDKSGGVKMGFKDGAVANLNVQPSKPPPPDAVPVKDEHKRNVLDPLSAVMALSLSASQRPCDRKLSIFDGKQRFDLALSFRRQQKITERRPSGQPGVGFVCKVRYMPIAGYRQNEETKTLADNGNIEITLRPVPSANLMVPYQVVIPTGAGTATMTAERIDITTKGRGLIALSH
jgi:hypothetical protein